MEATVAAIAFDTLKFARRLKEVGVPEAQAEAQAELMAEAFVFNMDALVTRDYLDQCLDARFAEHEARFEARLMAKMDARFAAQEARFEARFQAIEARLHNHDLQFAEIRGELKLHRWILALILATTTLPYWQKVFVLLTG
jgi:hypothetical protein